MLREFSELRNFEYSTGSQPQGWSISESSPILGLAFQWCSSFRVTPAPTGAFLPTLLLVIPQENRIGSPCLPLVQLLLLVSCKLPLWS